MTAKLLPGTNFMWRSNHTSQQELYTQPYETIDWPSLRNSISPYDVYAPHSRVAETCFAVLDVYDRIAPSWIRTKALERAYGLVKMEDENTGYQTIGPVSKAMNMLQVGPPRGRFGLRYLTGC